VVSNCIRRKHERAGDQHDGDAGQRPWREAVGELGRSSVHFTEAKQPKIYHRDGSDRHRKADEMQTLHGWEDPFGTVQGVGPRTIDQPTKEGVKHRKFAQVYRIWTVKGASDRLVKSFDPNSR